MSYSIKIDLGSLKHWIVEKKLKNHHMNPYFLCTSTQARKRGLNFNFLSTQGPKYCEHKEAKKEV